MKRIKKQFIFGGPSQELVNLEISLDKTGGNRQDKTRQRIVLKFVTGQYMSRNYFWLFLCFQMYFVLKKCHF